MVSPRIEYSMVQKHCHFRSRQVAHHALRLVPPSRTDLTCMFLLRPDLPPLHEFPRQREYEWPSYDAPRYPDVRFHIELIEAPSNSNFRWDRLDYDSTPPAYSPARVG